MIKKILLGICIFQIILLILYFFASGFVLFSVNTLLIFALVSNSWLNYLSDSENTVTIVENKNKIGDNNKNCFQSVNIEGKSTDLNILQEMN